MEFLGKTVKKGLKGNGFCSGTVRSYDSSSDLFEIVYEDGETRQLKFGEMFALMEEGERVEEELVHVKSRRGRKPKKRRRIAEMLESVGATISGSDGIEKWNERFGSGSRGLMIRNGDLRERLVENYRDIAGIRMDLSGNVDLNRGCDETLDRNCRSNEGLNGVRDNLRKRFDLNSKFNLNLNEVFDSGDLVNVYVDYEENFNRTRRGNIDLNLDVNCGVDETGASAVNAEKRVHGFDLNLEVAEDCGSDDTDIYSSEQGNQSNFFHMDKRIGHVEETSCEEVFATGELKEVHIAEVPCLKFVEEMRKQNGVSGQSLYVDNSDGIKMTDQLAEAGSQAVDGSQSNMSYSHEYGRTRRKRKRVVDDSDSAAETVLRRSARKISASTYLASKRSCLQEEPCASPAVSGLTEEKPVVSSCRGAEEPSILPPKLPLPPSSQNLNLVGAYFLDVFSVYAFLRSFSTLLFLSPFELEEFVESFNCDYPSLLFDSIHVSVLQTLRKHLEQLSSEGDQSASDCLRSLNWDLLDVITWPLFMVEYLLFHGSGLEPGLHLSNLKLFKNEYYKQPIAVKVEILRCLCDDLIDVEAIRSELNRRSLTSEIESVYNRNVNMGVCRKKRISREFSDASCLNDEFADDIGDWNSDECCLCKMDGNLLCCDGCPAAYHAKCVGVACHLLPEGDWFCPECAFDRHKPWLKPRKLLRGAELLGADPHGRQYYSSFDYLLVFDAKDPESSFSYYHSKDLNLIFDVLKSSEALYGGIINAICRNWDVPVNLNGSSSNMNSRVSECLDASAKYIPSINLPLSASDSCEAKKETPNAGNIAEKSDPATGLEVACMSSMGSVESAQTGSGNQGFSNQSPDCSNKPLNASIYSAAPGDPLPLGGSSLTSKNLNVIKEPDVNTAEPCRKFSSVNTRQGSKSMSLCKPSYWNCYNVARTTSLIAEEMMRKSSGVKVELKPAEDIISLQVKTILKNSNKFYWTRIHRLNLEAGKEKCGWCFPCKSPADDAGDNTECLFNMSLGARRSLPESEVGDLQFKNKKGHLIDVMCQMISVERRLRGLLFGPWLDPQYPKLWRDSVLKASSASCLSSLLLTLESNLHHRTLSPEWSKHVDPAVTMGSALHIVIASTRACSRNGIVKRRGTSSGSDLNPTANAEGGLSMCWWRGGRLSRQLFSWKALPRSLASKAARQAGRFKIPGIVYPENLEPPRRSKRVAWQAAVDSSTSAEQLALQIREFDLNIRWDDIENTHPLPALDKEARKSVRLFKKAIVRRKCSEGDSVNYLLDFGKRRNIPDVVLKNGSMVEESTSERKKYWLNESYVPLHLLRTFEDKRIARKTTKMGSARLSEAASLLKRCSRQRGLLYLFTRAERRSDYYQCGHCNKDVLVREAVCCKHCKGFFHKRHIRRSTGPRTGKCSYVCLKCDGGTLVKAKVKPLKSGARRGRKPKGFGHQTQKHTENLPVRKSTRLKKSKTSITGRRTVHLQNYKRVVPDLPLRRSTRRKQYTLKQQQNRKPGEGYKKRKRKQKQKPKKSTTKKPRKGTSLRKKRTRMYHSYWLNGLLLSRKPDDERVTQFRKDRYFVPSEISDSLHDLPKCSLCSGAGSTSVSSYIACEICGEWFHGDAYGLDDENIACLIGFRCHVCLKRPSPLCSQILSMKTDSSPLQMHKPYKGDLDFFMRTG